MSAPIVQANSITKRLGSGSSEVLALKDVNLSLSSGSLTVLMAVGKRQDNVAVNSRMHARTYEGDGRDLRNSTEGIGHEQLAQIRRQHIGFVFQSYHLFPTLTAAENVRMALDVRGERRSLARRKTREALVRVGLECKSEAFPRELSGGEQQRVAIARAIVAEPSAILADEPTGALDGANGQAVMAILSGIAKERNHAVLVVTHDTRLLGFADNILYIEDGVLQAEEVTNSNVLRMRSIA